MSRELVSMPHYIIKTPYDFFFLGICLFSFARSQCDQDAIDLKNQITMLKTFRRVMNISGKMVTFIISYKIDLTIFDNKVVNALTDTKSTQSCNTGHAKPNEMNNTDFVKTKTEAESALEIGISICIAG